MHVTGQNSSLEVTICIRGAYESDIGTAQALPHVAPGIYPSTICVF